MAIIVRFLGLSIFDSLASYINCYYTVSYSSFSCWEHSMDLHCGVSMVSSITILFSVSENLSKEELIEKLITIIMTLQQNSLTYQIDLMSFLMRFGSSFMRLSYNNKKLQQITNQESCSVRKKSSHKIMLFTNIDENQWK